jgi:hypothetical protein
MEYFLLAAVDPLMKLLSHLICGTLFEGGICLIGKGPFRWRRALGLSCIVSAISVLLQG